MVKFSRFDINDILTTEYEKCNQLIKHLFLSLFYSQKYFRFKQINDKMINNLLKFITNTKKFQMKRLIEFQIFRSDFIKNITKNYT